MRVLRSHLTPVHLQDLRPRTLNVPETPERLKNPYTPEPKFVTVPWIPVHGTKPLTVQTIHLQNTGNLSLKNSTALSPSASKTSTSLRTLKF